MYSAIATSGCNTAFSNIGKMDFIFMTVVFNHLKDCLSGAKGKSMNTEALTQYKLMILYLLHSVNYPLSNSQLSGFFLDNEYTTYFTLQQCISDLVEARLISSHQSRSTTRYEVSEEGIQTLHFFENEIPAIVKDDMEQFLLKNKLRLQHESSIYTDYVQTENQDFSVQVELRESKSLLCRIDLGVPDEESAQAICNAWKKKSGKIYSFLLSELLEEEGNG